MIHVSIKKGINLGVKSVRRDSRASPLMRCQLRVLRRETKIENIHGEHVDIVQHPEDHESAMTKPI